MNEDNVARVRYAMILNIILAVLGVIGLALCLKQNGDLYLNYYTQQSVILSTIAAAVMAFFWWRKLKKPKTKVPMWAILLKYASVVSLTITFLVVLLVLIPIYATEMGFWNATGWLLLSSSMVYTHTLCPIIAAVLFLFFERHQFSGWKKVFIALIPTFLYAAVAIILNIAKVWDGPYPFLRVYVNPIWQTILYVVGILGGAVLISKAYEVINAKISE